MRLMAIKSKAYPEKQSIGAVPFCGKLAILESIQLFPSLLDDENGDECYSQRNVKKASRGKFL